MRTYTDNEGWSKIGQFFIRANAVREMKRKKAYGSIKRYRVRDSFKDGQKVFFLEERDYR